MIRWLAAGIDEWCWRGEGIGALTEIGDGDKEVNTMINNKIDYDTIRLSRDHLASYA